MPRGNSSVTAIKSAPDTVNSQYGEKAREVQYVLA